jgi:membrane protease YdiL (CAAX protease family)
MTSRTTVGLRSLVFLVACPLVLIIAGSLTKSVSVEAGPVVVGTVTSILTFLLTVLFVRWDGLALRDVGTSLGTHTPARILFGLVVGSSIVALQNLVVYAGGHTHWIANDAPHHSPAVVLLAFVGFLMLGLREELAFRGYPLRRLESAWGMWWALIVIGIVFTLEHTASGWSWSRSLLGPPAGALLFGMAALATRGIAVPLGIHTAFNFGQWVMGQKEVAGVWTPIIDRGFERQADALGYAGYLAGMLLAAAGFWIWKNRTTKFDDTGDGRTITAG